MVVPILGGQSCGDDLQLLHKTAVAGDLIGLLQRCGHCRQVRFFQRPQPGRTALPPGAGVGDVKDIPQRRAVSAVVHKGNSPRPAFDVPPHAVVPEVIRRTGCGVRPLGVDHELIQVWILIEPGSSLQKSRPSAEAAGQLHRRMVSHLRVKFVFYGYGGSSLSDYNTKCSRIRKTNTRSGYGSIDSGNILYSMGADCLFNRSFHKVIQRHMPRHSCNGCLLVQFGRDPNIKAPFIGAFRLYSLFST